MVETIKKSEYNILCFYTMLSLFWEFTIYDLFKIAKQDSWISILLSFFISILPVWIYYLLLTHDSKLNIVGLIEKYFGKIIGKGLNLLFILYSIWIASLVLWNTTNFISSPYLYQTPRMVISILFIATSAYIVSKGLSTIGRTGIVLFILFCILFFLSALALLSKTSLDGFFPILEWGIIPIFKGSYITISYNIFPLFFLLIIPKDAIQNNKKLVSSFIKTYCFLFFSMFIVITFTTSVLGIKLASLYQYPEYHILKTINLVNFFQRVESILSTQMLFCFIMNIVIFLYYAKNAVTQTFHLQKYDKIVLIILSMIILFLSQIVFKNNTVAEYFALHIYPFVSGIILLIIPIFILLFVKMRKKI